MTKIICCKPCSKNADKVLEQKNYIQNSGVFYCNHVIVFEKKTTSKWVKKT